MKKIPPRAPKRVCQVWLLCKRGLFKSAAKAELRTAWKAAVPSIRWLAIFSSGRMYILPQWQNTPYLYPVVHRSFKKKKKCICRILLFCLPTIYQPSSLVKVLQLSLGNHSPLSCVTYYMGEQGTYPTPEAPYSLSQSDWLRNGTYYRLS